MSRPHVTQVVRTDAGGHRRRHSWGIRSGRERSDPYSGPWVPWGTGTEDAGGFGFGSRGTNSGPPTSKIEHHICDPCGADDLRSLIRRRHVLSLGQMMDAQSVM